MEFSDCESQARAREAIYLKVTDQQEPSHKSDCPTRGLAQKCSRSSRIDSFAKALLIARVLYGGFKTVDQLAFKVCVLSSRYFHSRRRKQTERS